VLPTMLDSFVVAGSLQIALKTPDGKPQAPAEVAILSVPTRVGEKEYELAKPAEMNVPATGRWDKLPMGEVTVEVRRKGKVLVRQEQVELDRREQKLELTVGAGGSGPGWVLKPGMPQIKKANATPTDVLTMFSPTLISRAVTVKTADGKERHYTYQWSLDAPPQVIPEGETKVSLNIIGQVTPTDNPPYDVDLFVSGRGAVLSSNKDPGGPNQMLQGTGEIGIFNGKVIASSNDTVYFTPNPGYTVVELDIGLGDPQLPGASIMHWEWQKQASTQQPVAPQVGQQQSAAATTPTRPTTPAAPTAPPGKLGITVKTVPLGNGHSQVVIVSVDAGSQLDLLVAPGDVIANFNGQLVETVAQVKQILSAAKPGDKMFMQVSTGGHLQTVEFQAPAR
jgi:hypothetical protein